MRNLNVLAATVTAGAGHLQAAAAIEEAWRAFRPSDHFERLDLLALVPRLQRKLYAESYLKLVAHAPELWGYLFEKSDNPRLLNRLSKFRRLFAEATNKGFVRKVRQTSPDVVVCTHFLPAEVLGHLKRNGEGPMAVAVVTDFEAHALWIEPCLDLYCVATEATKARLTARGVDPQCVVVTGIPVSARFGQRMRRSEARRKLGLRDDLPVLLILGGGFGMGPVKEVLEAVNRSTSTLQVIVVAGRNLELRSELATVDVRHPTRILGFVDNMNEWMAACDLVLTKPGGLTSSEALAIGRPMLVFNPIPGQEAANSDFLLERGAAAKVNRVEDLPFRLDGLIGSGELKTMSKAALACGRPGAAQAICAEVLRRLEQ